MRRYEGLVSSIATRTVSRGWEREDLTQEVWLQAWLSVRTLREPDKFPGWLSGLARNVCRHWLASERRRPLGRLDEDLRDSSSCAAPASVARLPGFEQLSRRSQTFLRLKYDRQRTYREIADRFHTTESTVQSALFRARRRLRRTSGRIRPEVSRMIQAELTSIDLWDEPDSKGRPRTLAEVTFREIGDGTELRIGQRGGEVRGAIRRCPGARASPVRAADDLRASVRDRCCTPLARGSNQRRRSTDSRTRSSTRHCGVESEAGTVAVDARPSDAVNLALGARAPIHFARSVAAGAEEAGKPVPTPTPLHATSRRPGRSALWPRHDSLQLALVPTAGVYKSPQPVEGRAGNRGSVPSPRPRPVIRVPRRRVVAIRGRGWFANRSHRSASLALGCSGGPCSVGHRIPASEHSLTRDPAARRLSLLQQPSGWPPSQEGPATEHRRRRDSGSAIVCLSSLERVVTRMGTVRRPSERLASRGEADDGRES